MNIKKKVSFISFNFGATSKKLVVLGGAHAPPTHAVVVKLPPFVGGSFFSLRIP